MRNTTTRTTPNLMAIDLAGCRINSDTPQSWRATLGAVPQIISAIRHAGLEPGPLREHDIVSRA